jgi:hypothetical protein
MDPQTTLAADARRRPWTIGAAILAAACLMVASVIQLGGPHTKVDELTLDLIVAAQRGSRDIIAAIVNAIGSLGIAVTLLSLYRSARARNPERVKPWIAGLTLFGAGLAAVSGIVYAVVIHGDVNTFVSTGTQTYAEANRLTGGSSLLILQLIGQLSALIVAVAFVLVSLQTMNQGLLPRWLAYGGMLAGALVLFQVTQIPVIQALWLLSIALLLSGRWPQGAPPAWRTGRSEPWPSQAEMRTRRAAAAAAARSGRGGVAAQPAPGLAGLFGGRSRAGGGAAASVAPERNGGGEPGAGEDARTRATTPKRKRKRRR